MGSSRLKRFFICNILLISSSLSADEADIKEIKKMLQQQNKILQQQQQTIEHFKLQNFKLRKILEKYEAVGDTYTNTAYGAPSTDDLKDDSKNDTVSFNNNDDHIETPNWNFSITPRTALRFNTFHDFSNDPTFLETREEPNYWTNGATVSVKSPWLPHTSILFSGLYGKDSGNATAIATQPVPGANIAFPIKMRYEAELLDFEILVRTMFKNTNAYWVVGLQYANFNTKNTITSGLPIFNGKNTRKDTVTVYLGKIGLGGFFNLSGNGHHRMFSNIMVGVGFTNVDITSNPNESWLGVGGDVNVGYQWIVDNKFSISPRYRAQVIYYDTENKSFEDQTFILHGPELHFTYRF